MERHTHEQAYFLFLYNPIDLYAVNKAVEFVPYITALLNFIETSVTAQHWSVRKQQAAVPVAKVYLLSPEASLTLASSLASGWEV